mgnify:CR=1 FL=1
MITPNPLPLLRPAACAQVHTAVLRARFGGEAPLAQHAQHEEPSWPADADPADVACGAAQGTRVDAELAGTLALALEGATLREPRIAVYCHTTGGRASGC